MVLLISCGDGTDSGLPDLSDFSVSDEEISSYSMSSADVMGHYQQDYATCLPAVAERAKVKFSGTTYKDLAGFFARNSGTLYTVKNADGSRSKEKKRTATEYIEAFNWSDKLDQQLPNRSICLPPIDVYKEIGPLPKSYVVEKIQARKRGAAIREQVAENFEKIQAPDSDGAYLVTTDFELIPLTAKGVKPKMPGAMTVATLPARIQALISGDKDSQTNVWCVRYEGSPVSIKSSNLYGVYLRNGSSFPILAFPKGDKPSPCANRDYGNYDDYVESGTGFGWSATRGNDQLVWMGNRHVAGDVYSIAVDRQDAWDDTTVALFRVEK